MKQEFEMVAKTMQGLEDVLADELRELGASNVEPGRRMVSFEGNLEMLYKANLCCRTALRILKPICKFIANDPDTLYDLVKEYNWGDILSLDKTFSIDSVVYSDSFTHSRYVTYRVKDAIVDWFRDRYGEDQRPGVRLQDADVLINVHIAGDRVTISLDSSGESLHKRGYRVAQTEAPINEVLAAGIILKSGWRGESPLIDPMCGSGTFLIEAALIAANINPGIYRRDFAFEHWEDFDQELFDRLFNDDSNEREVSHRIIGGDISPKAIEIARENIKSAGVTRYIDLDCRPLSSWDDAPENGILVTNPPYGERISVDDMDALYALIGEKLKRVFTGYHAWIIAYRKDYFDKIGLAPSTKLPILNGSLECELREYIIFEGDYRSFRKQGGVIRHNRDDEDSSSRPMRHKSDSEWRREARDKGFGGKQRRNSFPERRKPGFSEDKPGREKGNKFNRDDDKKFSRGKKDKFNRRDNDKFNRGKEDRFAKKFRDNIEEPRQYTPREGSQKESENPLAKRRSEKALKMLQGKQPSLLKDGNTVMRQRKGWKRQENSDSENSK